MARYYRRRYRTIVRAPKKKWATGYKDISGVFEYGDSTRFVYHTPLVVNSNQSSDPTPVIVKTGNFRVQFDATIKVGASGAIEAKAYVVYVPEGWNIGTEGSETSISQLRNIVAQHPEWILVWRQLDFGNANAAGTFDTSVVRMSSRLKRNLNSGDRIMFIILGSGDFTGIDQKGQVEGAAQYWTCAN